MCVCVCHHLFLRLSTLLTPQVLRNHHFRTASINFPLYSSRGQQGVHSSAANEDSYGYSVKQVGTPIRVP